jgi:hypothetical protein
MGPCSTVPDQSFEEQVFQLAATIEYGENMDGALVDSVDDSIRLDDQLTPAAQSEMGEFRDHTASGWS